MDWSFLDLGEITSDIRGQNKIGTTEPTTCRMDQPPCEKQRQTLSLQFVVNAWNNLLKLAPATASRSFGLE